MDFSRPCLERWFKITVGTVAYIGCVWFALQAVDFLFDLLVLVAISILAAYLMLAPVQTVERPLLSLIARSMPHLTPSKYRRYRHWSRMIAIFVVSGLMSFTCFLLAMRFVPVLMTQIQQLGRDLPGYSQQLETWSMQQPWLSQYLDHLPQPDWLPATPHPGASHHIHLHDQLFILANMFNQWLSQHMNDTAGSLLQYLFKALEVLIFILTGAVLVFYFLLDGDNLKAGLVSMMPKASRSYLDWVLSRFHEVMFGFIKSQVILGLGTGLFMTLLYWSFGVPYAVLLGSILAVCEIIPVIGTWLGLLPGIIVLLFISPAKLLVIAGIAYLYQSIKDNLVAPKIVGKVLGLHPIIIIISILLCAKLAGIVGIIFAIPLASLANVMLLFRPDTPSTEGIPHAAS